jgi:hypothetical protein
VNPKLIVAENEETHPYHRQEGTDGAKSDLSWCDTNDVPRKIDGDDGCIQRGESAISSPRRSLGMCVHGEN